MTSATVDANTVWSPGLYCRSPVVSQARWRQAVAHAATSRFVRFGSASPGSPRPLCRTAVAARARAAVPLGPAPGGRQEGVAVGSLVRSGALDMSHTGTVCGA